MVEKGSELWSNFLYSKYQDLLPLKCYLPSIHHPPPPLIPEPDVSTGAWTGL